MPKPSPLLNVEYLTRLMAALGALEASIKERVTPGVTVKVRAGGVTELTEKDVNYKAAYDRFVCEVSDSCSIGILCFLYQFEIYTSKDFKRFSDQYEDYFKSTPKKWESIKYYYPRIDQKTVCTILDDLSPATVGYRLEDLSRIGLIERSNLDPPHPKHVSISAEGIKVIEGAAEDGIFCLAPLFRSPLSFEENQTQIPSSTELLASTKRKLRK